jgi:mono/diheme cytochrome c family protein
MLPSSSGKVSSVITKLIAVAICSLAGSAVAHAQDVSIEKGARIAKIGGCHDCHTPGYNEAAGVVDPSASLIGIPIGYQGPWGTTYPVNLRLTAAQFSEDDFVTHLQTFETLPPMPWFNVHAMDEAELRSLHRYIVSLGEPGQPVPARVPPGEEPTTPYIVFVPVPPGS